MSQTPATIVSRASLSSPLRGGVNRRCVLAPRRYYSLPAVVAKSALRHTIVGLYLLFLIVENRLAECGSAESGVRSRREHTHTLGVKENMRKTVFSQGNLSPSKKQRFLRFHSELELLSSEDRAARPVAFTVGLEQNLMVGTYNQVIQAKNNMPSPEHFGLFMASLLDTVRDTIAECSEAAYDSLSIAAARELMMFDSDAELLAFVASAHASWRVENGRIFLTTKQQQKKDTIPSIMLLTENLAYATELERIV